MIGSKKPYPGPSPLAAFSTEWNNIPFTSCNTAAGVAYMSAGEKEVIYMLSLVRTDLKLFANTILQKYPDHTGQEFLRNINEYKSLLDTLRRIKPLSLLYPDSLSFISARCHAVSAGQSAYVGHARKTDDCKIKNIFMENAVITVIKSRPIC